MKLVLWIVVAVLLPPAVLFAYLWFGGPRRENLDDPVIAFGICVGLVALLRIPLKVGWRVVVCAIYVLAMIPALMILGLAWVCGLYHACL